MYEPAVKPCPMVLHPVMSFYQDKKGLLFSASIDETRKKLYWVSL